jgi:hypothetical protein
MEGFGGVSHVQSFTCDWEVLLFKNSPKPSSIQKAPFGTMGIFRPTVVVADDICSAKLAIELGK